jgi:FKBP-type peptidyl-prolyl cis-trans isomerase FklB
MNLVLISFALLALFLAVSADQVSYQKRTGKQYLDKVSLNEGAITLKSGMVIEVLKESTADDAKSPGPSDACEVTYLGTFKDGNKFDGGTTSFAPNQVIKGWTEAMQLMAEGDKWKLHIPYQLAYGERGSPPRIPGYSVLVFEIEIHKVKGGKGKSKAEARQKLLESTASKEDL